MKSKSKSGKPRPAGDKVIYVIRHGEKSYDYNRPHAQTFGCLSQMGWGRAYNLVSLFGVPGGRFRTPQYVYSAQYNGKGTYDIDDAEEVLELLLSLGLTKEDLEAIIASITTFDLSDPQGTLEELKEIVPGDYTLADLEEILRKLEGFGLNCRDENGWFRTQQTVSAVAAGLVVGVDNSTGFLPRLCEDPGECVPYSTQDLFDSGSLAGDCCNPHAAGAMVRKLEEESVDAILVAWEHLNIMFLSIALADFPAGNDKVDEVRGQVSLPDGGSSWDNNDYDIVYEFHYDCRGGPCAFVRLVNTTAQGFEWLGPKYGCGFSTPDVDERSEDETVDYLKNDWECIRSSR